MSSGGPLLVTERLELWQPRAGDHAGLVALMEPEPMRRFLTPDAGAAKGQFERLLRNAGSWSLYGYGIFTVRLRGGPEVIGTCGVFRSWRGFGEGLDDVAEAGWIVAHEQWARGIAGEAMRASLAWFDAQHGPERIACIIAEGNAASGRLARNLGFEPYSRHIDPADHAAIILYERLGG